MLNGYIRLGTGHIYQAKTTGALPNYDKTYSQDSYDKYDTTEKMSQLRLALANRLFKFSSVLDFGYGNGSFLKACHKQGIVSFGYDVSDYPLPSGIIRTPTENIEADLVTFFDSIEHLQERNLATFLTKLQTKQILITVPWMHEISDDWFYRWKHRRENEHFHHFTAGGLCSLMESAGFTPIYHGAPEDEIRRSDTPLPNILTMGGMRV